MQTLRSRVWVFLIAGSLCGACGTSDNRSAAVQRVQHTIAAGQPAGVESIAWKDVSHFYAQRSYEPAWVLEPARAQEAVQLVERAMEHGLAPGDYDHARLQQAVAALNDKKASAGVDSLAALDVALTQSLVALGRDVALGRTTPDAIDARWKPMREAPDFSGTLTQALNTSVATWLDTIRPQHPEYAALQKVLASGNTADRDRIALNMERWRWMPDHLGDRHLLVNLPAFHMAAREHGKSVLDMKVVVGTLEHETPIFSGEMNSVVFSPYWNVPDSIADDETAPAAARDPSYLARNNIEILRISKGGTTIVDPSDVDWDDEDTLKTLSFRQRPGADNALGHVKFLFPNKYDVYLHDTPADALFARPGRAFSHGCVRLEQPEELANYILGDRPEWTPERIRTAMHAGTEKHVTVKPVIPVHIVYFTAWPNGRGGVDSWPDLYGYDAKQAGTPAPESVRSKTS